MKPLEPERELEFPPFVEEPVIPFLYIPTPVVMIPLGLSEQEVKDVITKDIEVLKKVKSSEYDDMEKSRAQRNARLKELTDNSIAIFKAIKVSVDLPDNDPTPVAVPAPVATATAQTTVVVNGQTTTTTTIDNGVKTTVTAPSTLSVATSTSLADLLARSKLLLASLSAK
jgi:hypothetical protein